MQVDSQKITTLEEEAYRKHGQDLGFKFWPRLAEAAGYAKSGAGFLSKRCRGGYDRWERGTLHRIAVGLSKLLGREITLEDFVVDEDIPVKRGDQTHAKEVGSASR